MAVMMEVEDALALVLAKCHGLSTEVETVSVAESAGRVAAEAVVAPAHLPSARVSIKDGFAVKSGAVNAAEKGHMFEQGSKVFAGSGQRAEETEKDVVYVTTGSVVPDAFDAVVEVEQTCVDERSGKVNIESRAVKKNQEIRMPGSDVKAGTELVPKGRTIDAVKIGLLCMFGISTVKVFRRPVVGVLSTGDELIDPMKGDQMKGHHQVFDCNRPMILAAAVDPYHGGAKTVDLKMITDQSAKGSSDEWLEDILTKHKLDILVTSGAVSVGERDFVRTTIERKGEIHIEKLMMKPGKPLIFASVKANEESRPTLVFGLPGNPVSSIVTFSLLVAPAIRAIAGWKNPLPAKLCCKLAHDITLDRARPEFHRAKLIKGGDDGILLAESTGFQRSSALLSMLDADVLLELPRGDQIQAGTIVPAVILRSDTNQLRSSLPICNLISIVDDEFKGAQRIEVTYPVVLSSICTKGNLIEELGSLLASREAKLLVVSDCTSAWDNQIALEQELCMVRSFKRATGVEEQLRALSPANLVDDLVLVGEKGLCVVYLSGASSSIQKKQKLKLVTGTLVSHLPALFHQDA